MKIVSKLTLILCLLLVSLENAACAGAPPSPAAGKIRAVATTTIIGDVVQNVGGEVLDLHVLVPPGVDEHNFEYTPADVARIAEADVIFMSSPQLETFARSLIKAADSQAKIVSLSGNVPVDSDPHVWMDSNNVIDWVKIVAAELTQLRPEFSDQFEVNAVEYSDQLVELDRWIAAQVDEIPVDNRKLVGDHQLLSHFARQYGFVNVGAIIPSFSTEAAPTARELAALEEAIRAGGIKAIFTGNTANTSLALQIAADTGVQLVPIYTESLSAADGPASSYLNYMRYNVQAIVAALK